MKNFLAKAFFSVVVAITSGCAGLENFVDEQVSPFNEDYRNKAVYKNLNKVGCINPHITNKDKAIDNGLRAFNRKNGINLSRGWLETNPTRVLDRRFKPCSENNRSTVASIQKALITKRCLANGQADGVVGNITREAVGYFNEANRTRYSFQQLKESNILNGKACRKMAPAAP